MVRALYSYFVLFLPLLLLLVFLFCCYCCYYCSFCSFFLFFLLSKQKNLASELLHRASPYRGNSHAGESAAWHHAVLALRATILRTTAQVYCQLQITTGTSDSLEVLSTSVLTPPSSVYSVCKARPTPSSRTTCCGQKQVHTMHVRTSIVSVEKKCKFKSQTQVTTVTKCKFGRREHIIITTDFQKSTKITAGPARNPVLVYT